MSEYSNIDFLNRIDRHKRWVANGWDIVDNRRLAVLESKSYMLAGMEKRKQMRSIAFSADLRRWV